MISIFSQSKNRAQLFRWFLIQFSRMPGLEQSELLVHHFLPAGVPVVRQPVREVQQVVGMIQPSRYFDFRCSIQIVLRKFVHEYLQLLFYHVLQLRTSRIPKRI